MKTFIHALSESKKGVKILTLRETEKREKDGIKRFDFAFY